MAGTRSLERDPRYASVSVLSDAAANFRIPEKLNVAALNKLFFAALKPGGVYLVIDHVAETGSVFDGSVRGRTDQVVYRFRKPI